MEGSQLRTQGGAATEHATYGSNAEAWLAALRTAEPSRTPRRSLHDVARSTLNAIATPTQEQPGVSTKCSHAEMTGHATEQPTVATECSHTALAEHATEQPAVSTEYSHTEIAGHATEHPRAEPIDESNTSPSTTDRTGTRYIVSVYSLSPAHRPDAHTVVCIMLHKGLLRDDDMRAFIAQHIATGTVPQLTLGDDELMHTMNFVVPTSQIRLPALCEQLRDYCNRPAATRFQPPLLDGAGYTIGFLSLELVQWQHTRDVAAKLGETLLRSSKQYTGLLVAV